MLQAPVTNIFAKYFMKYGGLNRYDNPLTNRVAGKNTFAAAEINENQ
jgi:hypothetical protein